ncbi:MAG: HAD family hydrolase [Verrucomicrobia bacterium]|nr:HAD family hydrolase [Verrucomicrobiota bacterium]
MTTTIKCTREDLTEFVPQHTHFVGVDSDGCVFDSMEIKQKQCFHGLIASHWKLEPIEAALRETAEFVNLYSKWRGQNRFIALIKVFDLLRVRPEAIASGLPIPTLDDLRAYVADAKPLNERAMQAFAADSGSAEMRHLLDWSAAINAEIEAKVKQLPPFAWARKCLELMATKADVMCVSQTPNEALIREWGENDLLHTIQVMAGQELGTKTEHLALATRGRYTGDQVLMIGDAPGDRRAAEDNQALFYPINPAHEEASWERLYTEAFDRFLAGTFRGDYQRALIAEFEDLLPDTPPWA